MKSPKPYSTGRIVMYIPFATDTVAIAGNQTQPLPAVIVRDWAELPYYQEHSQVNLKVFGDGPNDLWRTSVPYDENKTPGSWHWPEIK
jgi:hypothetical protein